jgi:hypothetical protein
VVGERGSFGVTGLDAAGNELTLGQPHRTTLSGSIGPAHRVSCMDFANLDDAFEGLFPGVGRIDVVVGGLTASATVEVFLVVDAGARD